MKSVRFGSDRVEKCCFSLQEFMHYLLSNLTLFYVFSFKTWKNKGNQNIGNGL